MIYRERFFREKALKFNLLSATRNISSPIVRGGGKRKIKPKQRRKYVSAKKMSKKK